ncbi:MAG: DUF3301 domain-containing protein [Magnetococcales bacterium]|nr:DUF3301 domain-containing protein [Magnetococcales bacterium]
MEITLLLLLGVGFFWYSTMRARERGLTIARQVCSEIGMPLLDDTIFLSHLSLKRAAGGQLKISRVYTFRYLGERNHIYHASLILVGERQESLLLDTRQSENPK